jgi:hypothetical protein
MNRVSVSGASAFRILGLDKSMALPSVVAPLPEDIEAVKFVFGWLNG